MFIKALVLNTLLQVYKSRMIFITSCLLDVNALKLRSKNTAVVGFRDEGYYMMILYDVFILVRNMAGGLHRYSRRIWMPLLF